MSDLLRLAMIMPFLLNLFLKESSIKHNETAMIQQRIDTFRVSSVLKIIISCWIHIAKTMKAAPFMLYKIKKIFIEIGLLDSEIIAKKLVNK
ncbi:hypothetical protein C1646_776950 [Rhizophagus diaphanus]|nr:hypothetical protein C1646_776950 [Rhizophagus diaphanus] [Rhizophagus sp. MUCL 43196]